MGIGSIAPERILFVPMWLKVITMLLMIACVAILLLSLEQLFISIFLLFKKDRNRSIEAYKKFFLYFFTLLLIYALSWGVVRLSGYVMTDPFEIMNATITKQDIYY